MATLTELFQISFYSFLLVLPSTTDGWLSKDAEHEATTSAISHYSAKESPWGVLEEHVFFYQRSNGVRLNPEYPLLVDMFVMVVMSKTEQSREYMLPTFILWLSYRTESSYERDRVFKELLLVSLKLELSGRELEARLVCLERLVVKQERRLRGCCTHELQVTRELLIQVRLSSRSNRLGSHYPSSALTLYHQEGYQDPKSVVPWHQRWMKWPVVWLGLKLSTWCFLGIKLASWWQILAPLALFACNRAISRRLKEIQLQILKTLVVIISKALKTVLDVVVAALVIIWRVALWVNSNCTK